MISSVLRAIRSNRSCSFMVSSGNIIYLNVSELLARMLLVTDLPTFMYCPLQVYARKKLGYVPTKTASMLFGTIAHELVECIVKTGGDVLRLVSAGDDVKSIHKKYVKKYSRSLSSIIVRHKLLMKQTGLALLETYKKARPILSSFALRRATRAFELVQQGANGELLWDAIRERTSSEFSLESSSLGLKGRVDQVEWCDDVPVPIEFKTSVPPKEHAWEHHQIQVVAYAMMLAEKTNGAVSRGVIHYLLHDQERYVFVNPFLQKKVRYLIAQINALLLSNVSPKGCGQCEVCSSWKK
ncbi:CRISPR-associated protein Cas4 [Candidatus Woesearchaeota archaeon]|nr:CRISPR-associated protein Cas4 [Candidatus Woesearchaeota archaeon]